MTRGCSPSHGNELSETPFSQAARGTTPLVHGPRPMTLRLRRLPRPMSCGKTAAHLRDEEIPFLDEERRPQPHVDDGWIE